MTDWDEAEHPRDRRGRFADKRGGWVDQISDRIAGGGRYNYRPGRDMSAEVIARGPVIGALYRDEDPNVYGDTPLQEIARMQGFDGLPTVGTEKDLDAAIADGGVELWRGVGGDMPQMVGYGPDKGRIVFHPERSPMAYHEQWRSGDYKGGNGIYGQGLYASVDQQVAGFWGVRMKDKDGLAVESPKAGPKPTSIEELLGSWDSEGAVADPRSQMRMVLSPQARVIDYDDAAFYEYRKRVIADLEFDDFIEAARQDTINDPDVGEEWFLENEEDLMGGVRRDASSNYNTARAVLNDRGRAAAAMGYDAIRVPTGGVSGRTDGSGLDRDQYVILNRTALLVQEAYDESLLPPGVIRSDGTWG